MGVARKQVMSITVLSPRGRFFGDIETDELEESIMAESVAGNMRLIVNMKECESMNSVALGVMTRGLANYRGRGAEMKLCGLGKRLKDMFVMTRLIMVFDHFETEEEALASFVAVEQ